LSIYSGFATPTEAAGLGCLFAFILCVFIYRTLDWKGFKKAIQEASATSSMVLLIVVGALIYGNVLTSLRIPQMLAEFVTSYQIGKWPFIILVNFLYLVMGCFMEVISIMLITLPVFFPTIAALGIDPIWFNVILVINMELALITPPVGMNLFVIKGISGYPLSKIIQGVLPFMVLMFLVLILIILVPSLSTWLPKFSS
jgi:C4-dicarboxylate transporter DctM subunit